MATKSQQPKSVARRVRQAVDKPLAQTYPKNIYNAASQSRFCLEEEIEPFARKSVKSTVRLRGPSGKKQLTHVTNKGVHHGILNVNAAPVDVEANKPTSTPAPPAKTLKSNICVLCGEMIADGFMLGHKKVKHGERPVPPKQKKRLGKFRITSIVGGGLPSLGKKS